MQAGPNKKNSGGNIEHLSELLFYCLFLLWAVTKNFNYRMGTQWECIFKVMPRL